VSLQHRPVAVIVGAPGAGKSTVGSRVAQAFHLPFVDTDQLIEEQANMSVPDIFVTYGEPDFRQREVAAVREALENHVGIVALGGGAVIDSQTRDALQGHRVIWLKVDTSNASRRVGMNTARPLLVGNVRGTLQRLLTEREHVYESVSTDVVDTSGKQLTEVVSEVCALLEQR
jgi:shikimate kinase